LEQAIIQVVLGCKTYKSLAELTSVRDDNRGPGCNAGKLASLG